jgi:transcriptional regulator with XRE-family HTH domain
MLFGRLRASRKNKGWSLDRLANEAGCSKSYIWELEHTVSSKPSAKKLSAIAKALDVTVDYLLGNELLGDAKDRAFYMEYQNLRSKDQQKLQEILKILKEK